MIYRAFRRPWSVADGLRPSRWLTKPLFLRQRLASPGLLRIACKRLFGSVALIPGKGVEGYIPASPHPCTLFCPLRGDIPLPRLTHLAGQKDQVQARRGQLGVPLDVLSQPHAPDEAGAG